jgi:hypothetical protein
LLWNTTSPYYPAYFSVSGEIITPINSSISAINADIGRFSQDSYARKVGNYLEEGSISAYGSSFVNEDLCILTNGSSNKGQLATIDISTGTASVIANFSSALDYAGAYDIGNNSSTSAYGYALSALNRATGNDTGIWALQVVSKEGSTVTTGRVSFTSNTSASAITTKQPIRGMSFFVAGDYNSTHSEYAFSHPTATVSDNTWYSVVSTSADTTVGSVTLPSSASTAGFRIVSATGTDPIRRMFDGSVSYPPAPTGVTVPTSHSTNQVSSIKFSPNGKYLAIAYNRNTVPATGESSSVVVVYERQIDNSYAHIASSGTVITNTPSTNDAMQWTPDGSSIIVMSQVTTQPAGVYGYNVFIWSPGLTSEATISTSNVTTSWTVGWTKNPPAKIAIAPSVYSTKITSASGSVSQSFGTVGNTANAVYCYSSTSGVPIISVTGGRTGGNDSGHSKYDIKYSISGSVGSGEYPGYSNTVIASLPVSAGSIVQVSNIIVPPGDTLYLESSSSGSVDIEASGIEIT